MQSHGRQPVEIDRGVMHRMIPPEPRAVKAAMHPVADQVAEQENGNRLKP